MGYEAGREALRPKPPAPEVPAAPAAAACATRAPVPTPGLEAFFESENRGAERRLQKWYTDATNAVQDARNQMGRAGDRFADFAGRGVRSLKTVTGTAGGIATILFGTPGRAAGILANVLVDVAASSPSGAVRAGLARRLDDEKDAADAEVQRRYQETAGRLDQVAGSPAVVPFAASLDRQVIHRAPAENALYRDLLQKLVDDAGLHLDSGPEVREIYGEYHQSFNFPSPFRVDGREVANELNGLLEQDPSIAERFRSRERP